MADADYETKLNQLDELLDLLRKQGVTTFAGFDMHIVLGPAPSAPPREVAPPINANEHKPAPRPATPYDHPSLWPNGQKPSFQ